VTVMTVMTGMTSMNTSIDAWFAGPVTDFRSTVRGGAPSARYVVSP